MLSEQFAVAVDAARSGKQLDEIGRLCWRAFSESQINEIDAEAISAAIEARRASWKAKQAQAALSASTPSTPRRRPVSPDRAKSIARRRRVAASGALTPQLASHFTQAEVAALAIIAGEVKIRGRCELPIDAIAAMAGVGRTSVQNALRQARRLGLVSIEERRRRGQKSDTNVVLIIAPDWRAWLRLGGDRVQKAEHHDYSRVSKLRKTGTTAGKPLRSASVPATIRHTKVEYGAGNERKRSCFVDP
jgi:hypothetical protein